MTPVINKKPLDLKSLLLILYLFIYCSSFAQNPHILVNDGDKQAVINKVKTQEWARTILDKISKRVTPYADRHATDPQWILSRYQMNRIPGKYYTKVFSDNNGMRLVNWMGNAPYPTVRVSTYLRAPITEKGSPYRKPSLDELVPNDTSRVMLCLNPETGKKDWIDPQTFYAAINSDINSLALDAAILFWLDGDEKCARFAADIIDQWAKGAFYQEPIVGPCRTGFLDMQTLGDANYRPVILAYDFVKPYMKQNGYDMHWYDTVFEKVASTLAFRGFWNNNWYAAESSTMVFATLNIENKQKRDYYLQFILSKDTINGGCGQLALPSTVAKWLTPDGHWKEPGGYHNFPVGNLLISSLALEKNGYDVFMKFPALFKASYAMLKYSFPNLVAAGFGDTGRSSQSAESLEIGILGAIRYDQPILPDMLASMNKLIEGGIYKREESGFLGLLCYVPDLPKTTATYRWARTGTLDFARYFLQRNGTDPQTGLMIGVQCATYNHNHCNGMAIELYGIGDVFGLDAGSGPNYEHPLHRNYYSQWAAHNTVVAAGSSSSVPFNGAAGTKDVGQIELSAMEPMPDQEAVSPDFSFSDTRYLDKSTKTNQSRILSIIRTSPTSGYYVDIFRSDNKISNDYVYHNIGEDVSFLDAKRQPLKTASATYPKTELDYPGFRFFTEVEKLGGISENVTALFSVKDEKSDNLYLQALMQGYNGRSYFKAKSPKTKTSSDYYHGKSLPLFTVHTEAEARTKPFITVFEPFKGKDGYTVERIEVEKTASPDNFTALTVVNKDKSYQEILQATDLVKKYSAKNGYLYGYFGVASYQNGKISKLYLGKGKEISKSGYTLKFNTGEGSANLAISGNILELTCNQAVEITIPGIGVKSVTMKSEGNQSELKITKTGNQVILSVPAIKNGIITLN